MSHSAEFHPVVENACSTEPNNEVARTDACNEIVDAVNTRRFSVLDLAVLLAGPLTSPEKEARENGTRLLGEVVGRCRHVLSEGELHTLAEFLAARLRDWPCVGAAAAACRALLQPPPGPSPPGEASAPVAAQLRDDSALLVLEATAEMLRSAQSFRQDDRSALLQLLLAASRGRWGTLAAGATASAAGPGPGTGAGPGVGPGAGPGRSGGVPLLDAFLGAADGEKDPRCLMLAFEAVRALCEMHHSPGADAAPLAQLADEVADWASAYFPISFNPPPGHLATASHRPITRADLSTALERALAASPFLAGGVVPLLLEKLSSTYRPAKEDAMSALRRCCPAYGPHALTPHLSQLWQALRAEVMAPSGLGGGGVAAAGASAALPQGGAGAAAGGGGGGGGASEADSRLALAAAAAGCLTVVVRAAGPGAMDALALQDACVGDLLSVVRSAEGSASTTTTPTRGSSPSAQALARADAQVICGSAALAAIAAAGPSSLRRVHSAALGQVQAALAASLGRLPTTTTTEAAEAEANDSGADQTLYGMTVLTAVAEAVAAELRLGDGDAVTRVWLAPSAADGLTAMAEVKEALLAALAAVHSRLNSAAADAAAGENSLDDADGGKAVAMALDEVAPPPPSGCYSPAVAAQLRLAAVGAWSSLLRLHGAVTAAAALAAAPAATLRPLTLSAGELTAAAEQLCACALASAAAAATEEAAAAAPPPPPPSRMRWGRPVDSGQEAAAALQLLLQLTPLGDVSGGAAAVDDVSGAVVRLLVERLTAAMAGGGGAAAAAAAGDLRAAALRLAVQLTQAQDGGSSGGGNGGGAVAFTAALLTALQPLLLQRGSGGGDEEWLADCLTQLSSRVLPPLALSPPAATQQPTGPAAADTAAAATAVSVSTAAHGLVAATLAAAAEWEAAESARAGAGQGGAEAEAGAGAASALPFRGGAAAEAAAAAALSTTTHGSSAPLLAEWCAAVQRLTACCDDRQQLGLAMEAAELIAAASASAVSDGAIAGGPTAVAAAAAGVSAALACAVVAGLRAGVLAPHSTQALADSMLRLLAAAAAAARPAPQAAGGERALTTAAAAVALAAAINRWQDGASLDAWLASAFRPVLLDRLAAGGGETTATAAPPPLPPPSAAAVLAVGWVGRGLALRTHPALREVLEALLRCLRGTAEAAGLAAGAAGDAATEMEVEAGDGGADVEMCTEVVGPQCGEAASASAAASAAAAADAFGVLVAEAAAAGGVALVARPPQALCRVLWQQRTFSMCLQALESEYQRHPRDRQQQQQQERPGVGAAALLPPVPMAVAVARLAGSAPRQMCRNEATRLAPLLLPSVQTLCDALQGPLGAASAAVAGVGAAGRVDLAPSSSSTAAGATARAAADALREALAVVRDWLGGPKALPSAQLEKVLTDHVGELVECACAAARVGATAPPGRPGPGPGPTWRPQAAAPAPAPTAAAAAAAVDPALAAAVREEALRCCAGLMDSLPYYVLHPLRQQVLSCVLRALDDNRRSVRQLAVRARRAWGDT